MDAEVVQKPGLVCPQCGSDDTVVIDSRPNQGSIRRRRRCQACSNRMTTYEFIADPRAGDKVTALHGTIVALEGLRDELTIALENIRAVGRVAEMTKSRDQRE